MISEIYKKYKGIIITIVILFGLYIIKNTDNYSYKNNSVDSVAMNYGMVKTARFSANESFIQNNYIEIETKNSEKVKNKIEQETKKLNGMINQINSFNLSNKIGYNIIVKIPSEKVNNFIEKVIKSQGRVLNENFSIQNVSVQYDDNKDTIKNLTLRRDRLRKLMETSKKVDDILKIDKELTNVQNQLSNLERVNKNLKNDIELTTININLKPEVFLYNVWSLNSSFYKALQNLIIFSQKLIDLIIYVLLFTPYLVIVFFSYKFFKKNK